MGRILTRKIEDQRDIREILNNAEVVAEAICFPSEDLNKVKRALLNVLDGEIEVKRLPGQRFSLRVKGRGERSLDKIFSGFRRRMVLAAVRRYLKDRASKEEVTFMLNKQAAYVNVISIFERGESALGGVKVTIKAPDIKKLVNWLTRF